MPIADEQADVIAFLRCPENWAGTANCIDGSKPTELGLAP